MKRSMKYKGRNLLSYVEYGDRKGYPLLVQHGLIASISDHHLFESLIQAGYRIICVARPGYGLSSSYQMAHIAEWGEIMSALVDVLGLIQLDVLGMSSGAPYSYAIGYAIPDRVRHIYIFSGTPALYDDKVLEFWPYPIKKDASLDEMRRVAREVFFPDVTEEEVVRDDIKDSMMNDCFGIAQDLRLRCISWGFVLSEVRQAVYMEHSQTDREVPFVTAEMTAKMIPNCRLEVRDGEHFSKKALDQFVRAVVLRQQESQ